MELLERHEQILEILAGDSSGLSARSIYQQCSKRRNNQLKDLGIVSTCLAFMRKKEWVSQVNDLFFITETGIQALRKEGWDGNDPDYLRTEPSIKTPPENKLPDHMDGVLKRTEWNPDEPKPNPVKTKSTKEPITMAAIAEKMKAPENHVGEMPQDVAALISDIRRKTDQIEAIIEDSKVKLPGKYEKLSLIGSVAEFSLLNSEARKHLVEIRDFLLQFDAA